ncbi:unnamed protein product [Mytilus edulis]|uniref:CUB domain-containing protein n=1 Tax=Mytilus edulis TaxID=6550 RepID=A0A8S3VEZ8_MYTED|nr:unnamed protein product [Mytilus edulis]
MMSSRNFNRETSSESSTLHASITNFQFLITLVVVKNCMAFTRGLSTKLQGRTLDIVAAYKSVSVVKEALTDVRKTIDERFSEWFAETEELAKTVAVEPSIPRRCGRQTQRENCPADTPEIYYRRVIGIPYLDDVLSGMEARFSRLTSTAIQALKLVPAFVQSATFDEIKHFKDDPYKSQIIYIYLNIFYIPVPDAIDAQCSSLSTLSWDTNEQVIEKSKERDDKEEWVIIKPSASTPLAIVVEDMDIEDSHHCGYDYLAVYDDIKLFYCREVFIRQKKAKLCNDRKGSWTLTGNKYSLIRFHSDTDRTGKGFKLRFYLGTVEEPKGDSSALHAILIGLIAACIVVIFLLASAKLYMRCFKKPKVRPNQDHLRNRRAVLEATFQ